MRVPAVCACQGGRIVVSGGKSVEQRGGGISLSPMQGLDTLAVLWQVEAHHPETQGGSDDPQAGFRTVPPLLSQAYQGRQAPEPRHVRYAGGSREARTGGAVFQAPLRQETRA